MPLRGTDLLDQTTPSTGTAWGVRSRLVTAGLGYQQVRSVVAAMAGDRAGAGQPRLARHRQPPPTPPIRPRALTGTAAADSAADWSTPGHARYRPAGQLPRR